MINEHTNKTIHTFYEFCYWTIANRVLIKRTTNNVAFFKLLEDISKSKNEIDVLNNTFNFSDNANINRARIHNLNYISWCRDLWFLLKKKNIKPIICFFEASREFYYDRYNVGFGLCYRTQDNKFYFPKYYFDNDFYFIMGNFSGCKEIKLIDMNNSKILGYNQGLYEFSLINERLVKTNEKSTF